jgi:hypothetical protein
MSTEILLRQCSEFNIISAEQYLYTRPKARYDAKDFDCLSNKFISLLFIKIFGPQSLLTEGQAAAYARESHCGDAYSGAQI